MDIIKFENAEIGRVYVSQGGLAKNIQGNNIPWGYERVKLLRKETRDNYNYYIVETPWGTELEISGNYPLCETPETDVFSEHGIIKVYKSIIHIPFKNAVQRGICKIKDQPDNLREKITNYFNVPRKIADAARYFNIPYPRLRGYIQSIEKSGIKGINYKIIESMSEDNKKMIQLVGEK